jgi:phage-related minor tail protein
VGTGATGEALAGLEGSFKTVFTAVPTTTAAAATAIADVNTRLGLTGEPLEALATQFLNFARITGTDVAAAISSTTRVMHDFDVSTEDQAAALDYLFKVSQSTGIGVTQLGNSMTQYGSVMRQMGFDIYESAVLLGKFEKEGVNLELVLGSLRQGLAKFSKAGEEPVEALQRVTAEIIGMSSVADANALAMEVFGARAGPDMAAAMREGRFSIEETMATIDASSETINKAAADTMTFGDTWTLFKNKIMAAIEPIGDVILNVLGGTMNAGMAAFALMREQMEKFKAAIAPLTNLISDLFSKLSGGRGIFQMYIDYLTILWAGVKLWGDVIIWLVKHAIILLVNHIRETIKELTAFYNKLGPLKDLIGFVKGAVDKGIEGFHNYAESFREVEKEADNLMDRLDTVIVDLEGVTDKVAEIPKVIVKEWKKAVDAFEEGTGSYKDAIGAIDAEIEKLTVLWKRASEDEKATYEDWLRHLYEKKEAMIEADKISTETLNRNIGLTKEAIEKTKDFIITIGDTTIEFKGAAAEVLKNADAYDKFYRNQRRR